jgi:AcrR family transcriptional regulator
MYLLTTEQSKKSEKQIKAKILKSAYNLFITNGYHNVTILNIAQEASVSRNTVYNYYQGKSSILKKLIEKHFKTGDSKNNNKLKGSEYLKFLIDQTFDRLEDHCGFLRVIYPMVFFTDSFSYLKEFLFDFTIGHINRLEEAFAELGYINPYDEARGLITEIDGINLHYMTVHEMYPVQDIKEMLYTRYQLS